MRGATTAKEESPIVDRHVKGAIKVMRFQTSHHKVTSNETH